MIRDVEYEQIRTVWAFVRRRRLNWRAWCRCGIVGCSRRISANGRRASIPTALLVTTGTGLSVRLLLLRLPWHCRSPIRALTGGIAPGALCTTCCAGGSRQLPSRVLRICRLSRILLSHRRRVQHIIETCRIGTLDGFRTTVLILILHRVSLGSRLILLRPASGYGKMPHDNCEI